MCDSVLLLFLENKTEESRPINDVDSWSLNTIVEVASELIPIRSAISYRLLGRGNMHRHIKRGRV